MAEEISQRHIHDGYSEGTFYSLGPFSAFLNRIGSQNIVSPQGYGNVEGGKGVWLTPEGIGVLYAFWKVPEKFTLSGNPHSGGTRWPGMVQISAFGLEAKIDSFEAQVKQEAEKFAYEKMVKYYDLTAVRSKDGKSTFFV